MIDSIGAQLRSCRIFVSDDVVRSIADGARVRHGGGLLAADNGRLREVKVWRAGEKDKPTSEYMAVRDWSRAGRKQLNGTAADYSGRHGHFDRAGHPLSSTVIFSGTAELFLGDWRV